MNVLIIILLCAVLAEMTRVAVKLGEEFFPDRESPPSEEELESSESHEEGF